MEEITDDLNKFFGDLMQEENSRPRTDFEGYSPDEMNYILYDLFGLYCPVQLKRLKASDYRLIPIFNQFKYLLNLIAREGEIKLTQKGYLPTRVVAEVYGQDFIMDYWLERRMPKQIKETDVYSVNLTHILLKLSGLIKKRNGKISLTKAGEEKKNDDYGLLYLLFKIFGEKFNWSYYDGFGDHPVGQSGYGFTLVLLSKYGNEKRLDRFYADKYFKAFPGLKDYFASWDYGVVEERGDQCYSLRTFERFLDFFGLIRIESEDRWDADKYISKTELFDKLIRCNPHRKY